MLLRKSPALALLPVSPGDDLAAGCLYLIPYLVMLHDAVIIDGLAASVD